MPVGYREVSADVDASGGICVITRAKSKRRKNTTHISFRGETLQRLREYAERNYPGHQVISILTDKAVKEWLDRNDNGWEGPKG